MMLNTIRVKYMALLRAMQMYITTIDFKIQDWNIRKNIP